MTSKQSIQTAWFQSIPGVKTNLLAQNSSEITPNTLKELGFSERETDLIIRYAKRHPPQELGEWCERNAVSILTSEEFSYPQLLSQISDPPSVLYIKGTLPSDLIPMIAVVGTRQITPYGKMVTEKLTSELVEKGMTIVSGMMYGVDTVAHLTAVKQKGTTIGVLGYGFGVPYYPREQEKVANAILESGGCLITEYPPWQTPTRYTFPKRNRIVSGLSLGVVVTEAAAKSGSKITARLAAEQGREVFAVPGPIDSPYSEGTKELINLGATLITSAVDIMEQLRL
ncbi:DNA-processing protein DprA [Candidatus Woesebacteria bacterium]|nr:DNA-processing protein DprA [Candidatus Woesebacteria bacterium]